ncbi:MAG: hypothetical protein SFY32_05185 [Bacteroidota bacterium]|nr:hypothetical protein [Bacteroidota bacterium]
MTKLIELSELIFTLSKSEKRYFSIANQGKSDSRVYMYLFQLIERKEIEIDKKFALKFPKSNIEMARKQLYCSLMKALRNYEDEKSIESKIMNGLKNSYILWNKGAYSLAIDEIHKTKKKALAYQNFIYCILCDFIDLQIHAQFSYEHLEEENIIKSKYIIDENIKNVHYKISQNILFHLLENRFTKKGYVSSDKEKNNLNDLLLEEFKLNTNKRNEAFEAKRDHLLFQASYFKMLSNHKAAIKVYQQINTQLFEKIDFWKNQPISFLMVIKGVLDEFYMLQAFENLRESLKDLKKIETLNSNDAILKEAIQLKYNMLLCFDSRSNNELNEHLKIYEENLINEMMALPPAIQIESLIVVSNTYFRLEKYSESLKLIKPLLNQDFSYISVQQKSIMRILFLMIHIELQNDDFLDYQIRNFKRMISRQKLKNELEMVFIAFISKYLKKENQKESLIELSTSIERIKENPVQLRILVQLPLELWVMKKLKQN